VYTQEEFPNYAQDSTSVKTVYSLRAMT